jgi:hypothetical protein
MMKNIIIATIMFIASQFVNFETANAQTVTNMSLSVTRNEILGQTMFSGSVPNSPFNTKKKYATYSSYFDWSYNGTDIFYVSNFTGFTDFWLRPTLGKPNPKFHVRVMTPGVTVNFNGIVLNYNNVSSFTWPANQPFGGNIIFDPNRYQFQQVIFSVSHD